jgi:cell wall assembly regulator SMI1
MTVTQEWTALITLLRDVAPETAKSFRPPLPAAEVTTAEASIAVDWPHQLREFLSLHDGQHQEVDGSTMLGGLLPMQDLLGVNEIVAAYRMLIEIWEQIADENADVYDGGYAGVIDEFRQAGSVTGTFLPSYIPISGLDSYYYFVDTRPGPHHGCVRAYDKYEADGGGPIWASLNEMLAAIRSAVSAGTCIDGWPPTITSGALTWAVHDDDDGADREPTPPPLVVSTGYDVPAVSLADIPEGTVGVDRNAVQRAVLAAAAATYGAYRVSGGYPVLQFVPRAPGFNIGCSVEVNGNHVFYVATVTDVHDEFIVTEVPPEGVHFTR